MLEHLDKNTLIKTKYMWITFEESSRKERFKVDSKQHKQLMNFD